MNNNLPVDKDTLLEPEGWQKKTALFISSQAMSLFGSMLVMYAIIWYVTLTTKSGAVLTISTLASFLPQILISPFAGVWADRYHRKFLIIAADLLTAVSTVILAVAFLIGYRELWLIFAIAGIRSIGGGIQMPAVNALLPQIVPADRLIKVNSINSTIQPFIMIIAPVLAGALLSFSRLEYIFFIDVITALIAVGLMFVLRVGIHQRSAESLSVGYLDDMKAGLAYIAQNSTVKRLFTFFGFIFFLITPVAFMSPLFVTRKFGDEVWMLTANEVTFFGGSILGGVLLGLWGGFNNRFKTIGFSCVLWGLLFAGLGVSQILIIYLIVMFLAGLPMPIWNASTTTLLQETVQPDMQGRVFSVQQLIMNTVMPLGMLVFGPIADVISIEVLLVVTGILMSFSGLWLFFYRLPQGAQSFLDPRTGEMQPGD